MCATTSKPFSRIRPDHWASVFVFAYHNFSKNLLKLVFWDSPTLNLWSFSFFGQILYLSLVPRGHFPSFICFLQESCQVAFTRIIPLHAFSQQFFIYRPPTPAWYIFGIELMSILKSHFFSYYSFSFYHLNTVWLLKKPQKMYTLSIVMSLLWRSEPEETAAQCNVRHLELT